MGGRQSRRGREKVVFGPMVHLDDASGLGAGLLVDEVTDAALDHVRRERAGRDEFRVRWRGTAQLDVGEVGVAHDQVELVDGVAAGVILRFDERRIAVVVLAGRGQVVEPADPPPGRDPHAESVGATDPRQGVRTVVDGPVRSDVDQPTVVARERAGGRRALRRVALAAPTFVFRESGSQSHGFPAIPEVKALTNEAVCGLLREAAENGPRVRAIGDRPQRSNNEDPGCRWGRHASSRTPAIPRDRRDHGACTARSGPERILRVARCRRAARQ